jgi:lipopolysaccharide heptosyltransferase II
MVDHKAWEQAKRILCIRLDSLGDVLMTTPAIRALRASAPGRSITLLTSPAGARAAALIPEVDEVISYDAPWMKATAPRASSKPEYRLVESLRRLNFDAAVIFTVYSQNPLPAAFLAYLAGIPLRLAHCRENPYQLLTHWVPEREPQAGIRHEVRRQLDLVITVGSEDKAQDIRLSLQVPPGSQRAAQQLLDGFGIDLGQPWVVIHPGATAPSRRYRPDGFAQVARILFQKFAIPAIFTGTRAEVGLIEEIRAHMGVPSYSLADQIGLPTFAALLDLAPLLISNNSGPVHVAAAVGTPVVDLYALTNPQHTPWGVPHRVLNQDVPCKYCYKSVCPEGHHNCLARVTPEEVVQAALDLLREATGAPRRVSEAAL